MEQDSAESEEAGLQELLLPDGKFPLHLSRFSISINYELLHGWVKQPSPCCAAASVAGAVNALRRIKRAEDGALGFREVLQIYADILSEQANKHKASAERCLGASLTPLEEALDESLAALNMSIDEKAVNKKLVTAMVREIVEAKCCDPEPSECFELLKGLIEQDVAEDPDLDNNEDEEEPGSDVDESKGNEVQDSACTRKCDQVLSFDFGAEGAKKKKKKGSSASTEAWSWSRAVWSWIKKKAGVGKLLREKPSTAPIGSWGILAAVKEIGNQDSSKLWHGRTLMSRRGASGLIKLSQDDSDADIDSQWAKIREEFSKQEVALLFHLTNHYALIYGLREWVDPDGTVVKQLLTARKGQRPTVWLDWAEARQIMIKWGGYNIVRITASPIPNDEPCPCPINLVEAC